MGYHIRFRGADFRIDSENTQDALRAIKDLMVDPDANRSGGTFNPTDYTPAELAEKPDDFTIEGRHGTYTLGEIPDTPGVELEKNTYGDTTTITLAERHFSWMNNADPDEWETLEDAMASWGYPIETDDEGNVIDIRFHGQKIGDEDQLFDAIAPYVEDGSYIEMTGEDDYVWRWVFNGNRVEEVEGEVVF